MVCNIARIFVTLKLDNIFEEFVLGADGCGFIFIKLVYYNIIYILILIILILIIYI